MSNDTTDSINDRLADTQYVLDNILQWPNLILLVLAVGVFQLAKFLYCMPYYVERIWVEKEIDMELTPTNAKEEEQSSEESRNSSSGKRSIQRSKKNFFMGFIESMTKFNFN